ncbi:uncharacterized protein EV422DRAFT_602113 [Fimicolochytrium jonesii]|uniref:uncharacterized protein n=1 Tax=Fimicolochytrium jonesii TaxID=1396493 RepID=UPI0022FF2769|nr:uncharacterized protein EV422DRAFT_602113 [Fimicolochytrium jonesii]KAI8818634.1 hypothetical protein EV422DRAFT_602113 [Fimicolochytrium jonesii]
MLSADKPMLSTTAACGRSNGMGRAVWACLPCADPAAHVEHDHRLREVDRHGVRCLGMLLCADLEHDRRLRGVDRYGMRCLGMLLCADLEHDRRLLEVNWYGMRCLGMLLCRVGDYDCAGWVANTFPLPFPSTAPQATPPVAPTTVEALLMGMGEGRATATFGNMVAFLYPLLVDAGLAAWDASLEDKGKAIGLFSKKIKQDNPTLWGWWINRPTRSRHHKKRAKHHIGLQSDIIAAITDGGLTAADFLVDPRPSASRPAVHIVVPTPASCDGWEGKMVYAGFGKRPAKARGLDGLEQIEPRGGADIYIRDKHGALVATILYNSVGRREHDLRLGLIVESCGSRPALVRWKASRGTMHATGLRRGVKHSGYARGTSHYSMKGGADISAKKFLVATEKAFTKRLLRELTKRNPTAAAYLMMSMPEVYGPHSDEFTLLELNPHTGRAIWKLTPKEELPEELQARKLCTQWVAGYAVAPPTIVGEWIFALPEQGFYLVLQPDCIWTWMSDKLHGTAELDTSGVSGHTAVVTLPLATAAAIRKYGLPDEDE